MTEQEINALFQEAVQQNWNNEMEWLWLAELVTSDEQRITCLQHALHINPDNRNTQRQLEVSQAFLLGFRKEVAA